MAQAPTNPPPSPERPRVPRAFVAQVRREGSCPVRLRAGDRITLLGAALRTDGCRPCAYAICDLVPAARRMEQQLDKGSAQVPPQAVVCTGCADPQRRTEFGLAHIARAGRPRTVTPEQKKIVATLKRFPLLKPLPDATLLRMAGRVRRATYCAGTVLLKQGERGRQLFLVDRGEVGVHRKEGRAKAKQIARIGPGECFGEMSLLTGEPISATIRTSMSVELLVIDQPDFKALLAANPGMNHYFNRLVAERAAKKETTRRIEPGMFGSLADFSPAELMQSLQAAKRRGRLRMRQGKSELTIDFDGGRPVHVLGTGDLDENPEEAMYQVLHWTKGRYEFDALEDIVGRSFFKDLTALLLEAIRHNDDELAEDAPHGGPSLYEAASPYEGEDDAVPEDGPTERGEFQNTKGLKTVMQAKQNEKADGRVQVRGKLGLKLRVGSIWLSRGRIVAASFEDFDGEQALKQIVKLKSGEWCFGPGMAPDELRAIGRYGVEEMFAKGR